MTAQIKALIALVIFAAGLAVGWAINGWCGTAKVADCRTEQVAGRAQGRKANRRKGAAASTITITDTLTSCEKQRGRSSAH